MGFYPVMTDTTMQIHPHAAAPWGNRCSFPRFCSILPALAPLYQPRVVSDFWPWAQGHTDENLFWMGIWAWSPNHTLPRWPKAWHQALSLSAEMKPLPVTQPHTNKASATGLLSFNTCLSKYLWRLFFSDSSIGTLIFYIYIYICWEDKRRTKSRFWP